MDAVFELIKFPCKEPSRILTHIRQIVQEMLSDGIINYGRLVVLYKLVQYTQDKTKVNVTVDVLTIILIKTFSIW